VTLPQIDSSNLFDVAGKSAIVVGATGSFGKVVAATLGYAGAKLVVTAGNADTLAELGKELQAANIEAVEVARRPDTEEDCETIVTAAVDAYGRVDILVVASGFNEVAPIVDMAPDRFKKIMLANVDGFWLMARAAGKKMIEQGRGGKVVFTSSARGRLGHPAGYSAYCTSKSAVDGMTRALGCEWGKYGITVNAIAPTVFRSPLTAWMFEGGEEATKVRDGFLQRVPIGRLGEPEDLAGPLLFLCSNASDFYTGHIVYADGGYTAG
jgi:NAD(P)-dependent dehydrogenase (short-subunit alcohol dehydrogenase family)